MHTLSSPNHQTLQASDLRANLLLRWQLTADQLDMLATESDAIRQYDPNLPHTIEALRSWLWLVLTDMRKSSTQASADLASERLAAITHEIKTNRSHVSEALTILNLTSMFSTIRTIAVEIHTMDISGHERVIRDAGLTLQQIGNTMQNASTTTAGVTAQLTGCDQIVTTQSEQLTAGQQNLQTTIARLNAISSHAEGVTNHLNVSHTALAHAAQILHDTPHNISSAVLLAAQPDGAPVD